MLKPVIRIDSQGYMTVVNNTYRNAFYMLFDLDIAVDYCQRNNSIMTHGDLRGYDELI